MLVGKKPFMAWDIDELKKKMEEFREESKEKNKLNEKYLATVKKNQWKKAMKK
jgi:hypothetical protein